jgi:hypothetical protein
MASLKAATLITVDVLHAADTTTKATHNGTNKATNDNKSANTNNDDNGNVAWNNNACMEDNYYEDNSDEDDDFYYPDGDFRKFCLAQQQQSSFVIDLTLLHGSDFADDATIDNEQDITSKQALQSIIPLSPQDDMD